jgi:YYY domain-containing protein
VANEGDWDDGLPLRVDGYDAFGGLYTPGLNFNMYWDDNLDKLTRFTNILDQAEYIFISSNRQWGSLPRIPERFPLTSLYYRELLGCPDERTIQWCYSVAEPGQFEGRLGFELVQVFQSDPALVIGGVELFRLNDQFAEEAFTVYDHPKVLIFRKSEAYNPLITRAALSAVDFTKVVHLTPKKAASYKPTPDLMLPADRQAEEQAGGTWSELFDRNALHNRFQALGVVVWYVSLTLLGLCTYPLLRLALPGLSDHGYPLARAAGLLLLAYLAWLAGSLNAPVTRVLLGVVLALIAVAGGVAAFFQRAELRQEWQDNRKYFLIIEGLVLAFFLLDLGIRLGNPDLWHPWKGGEKPMDFAYFNAVLKSTNFPPYDPWYAGGYLNYYYYGFVYVGMLVKFLGLVPAFAYNLILPTMFSLLAMGAFSLAWNFARQREGKKDDGGAPLEQGAPIEQAAPEEAAVETAPTQAQSLPAQAENQVVEALQGGESLQAEATSPAVETPQAEKMPAAVETPQRGGSTEDDDFYQTQARRGVSWRPYLIGIAAAVGLALLGNLGTVSMILRGYQALGAPHGFADLAIPAEVEGAAPAAGIGQRAGWLVTGFLKALSGAQLPYGLADWYWNPSRAIPIPPGDVEPITEFPFFTFLYADPHAHMFALPITVLALAWMLSWLFGRGCKVSWGATAWRLALGGLIIGALRPTNTWDLPTYLILGALAVGYGIWLSAEDLWPDLPFWGQLPAGIRRVAAAAGGMALLVGLAFLFYEPYARWYALGYTKVDAWKGSHTPISAYLVHWGLFLFLIVSWLAWETRDWMAKTPLSALRKLREQRELLTALLIVLGIWLALLLATGLAGWANDKELAQNTLAWWLALVWVKAPVTWVALPLMAWAGILLLRRGQPVAKQAVLFMFGTALALTVMVELIVLVGDIGRMNTVFKFYLQAWTLLAVCAAAALAWLWPALKLWLPAWRIPWQVVLTVLVMGAALYPLTGGITKIKDRMVAKVPLTLDGMDYMQYATYDNLGTQLTLREDYNAIRWMQDTVKGSPVIVEGIIGEQYRWFSRFSIYTGLPDVAGWEWHQRQQRVAAGEVVIPRVGEVGLFYGTTDRAIAQDFLKKYNVRYIILGALERGLYPGPGLDKFWTYSNVLWQPVFQDGAMVIYEVLK